MEPITESGREALTPHNEFGLVSEMPNGTRLRGGLAGLTVGGLALLTRPFSNTIFGDHFSYARTALEFSRTGHFVYNGWATAMLGWQIVWADLFIKAFGFSFDVLRLSVLLLSILSVYLFHQVLIRFGIKEHLAFFGTLTLGLTPLFFPLAVSFMSDIPGLFVSLLCVALCQRAILASTAPRTVGWLVAAALTNVVGGTARQICWLGVLVMVPCTAWLLRGRRGVLVAGCLCTLVGALTVRFLLHWFVQHPHVTPEHLNFRATRLRSLRHLADQEARSALLLVFITAPVGVALLRPSRQFGRGIVVRVTAVLAVVSSIVWFAGGSASVKSWSLPWMQSILSVQGMEEGGASLTTLRLGVRACLALATLALGWMLIEVVCRQWPNWWKSGVRNKSLFWLLGPFSGAILAMMSSRAMFAAIQDRYLLQLIPQFLILLLCLCQDRIRSKIPGVSVLLLCIFAGYGLAGLHDIFASARAIEAVYAEVRAAGVPRQAVAEGFGEDEWFEVDRRGFLNNVAAGPADFRLYKPNTVDWHLPNACMPDDYDLIPSLHPRYILATGRRGTFPAPCYLPSQFPGVQYRTWLPPVHRVAFAGIPAGKPAGERPYLRNQWGSK